MHMLDRHDVDRVARAVVSGERSMGRPLDRLADAVAIRVSNRLAAVGAPGAARAVRLAHRRSALLASDVLGSSRLMERVAKHVASWAMVSHGRPHPR